MTTLMSDRLWVVRDRASIAFWRAWGILPPVSRYRDLGVKVDEQQQMIGKLGRLVVTLAEVVNDAGIAELERRNGGQP